MKVSIEKRFVSLFIIIINIFFTGFITFLTPFTILSEYDNGFFAVVANNAQQNEHKNVIFSYNREKENSNFVDNYYSYYEDKTMPTKHKSMLLSPSENNGLVINNIYNHTTVILHNKIYASKQSDGKFKMSSGNYFYHNNPFDGRPTITNKSVSVSEAIANKLMSFFKVESFYDLNGAIVDFQYKNSSGEIEIEKMYIRGVLMSERGDMPKHIKLYGEDIVLFYPDYFNFYETEAHFYFNQSVKSNQDNFKFIENFGLGDDITIKNAKLGVDNNIELQEMFENRLESDSKQSAGKVLLSIVYFPLIFLIFLLTIFLVLRYKNSISLSVFIVTVVLVLNELLSILISLIKYNPGWQIFNNSKRGVVLIIYCILLLGITYGLNKFKKSKIND